MKPQLIVAREEWVPERINLARRGNRRGTACGLINAIASVTAPER